MNRIPLIIAVLTFCVGIGFSNAEVYKWVDKDGVEHFSDYKTDIPPGTPFEAHDETLFDPAADAKREAQDKKTMEAVDQEEDQMISETKREDEQAAQREKAEKPASTVIEKEGDDNDDIYWRDHERRRAGELNERDQFEHNENEHNEIEHKVNEHHEIEHHEIEHRVVHPVAR